MAKKIKEFKVTFKELHNRGEHERRRDDLNGFKSFGVYVHRVSRARSTKRRTNNKPADEFSGEKDLNAGAQSNYCATAPRALRLNSE